MGRVYEIEENQGGKTLYSLDDTTGKITIQLIKKDSNIPKSLQGDGGFM